MGLHDDKVGSMQYFEGLLYMLFDNARVIRGFDLRTGEMAHEISLPVAKIGSGSQWEGMRLQRVGGGGGGGGGIFQGGLRGSDIAPSASQLVLHLALDTPAQVWSIRLDEEKARDGQRWVWPDCAAV